MVDFDKIKYYAPVVLRISIAVLFLWFGFEQAISPEDWTGFLPSWISNLSISAVSFIYFNAVFEIIFGFLLLLGLFTRTSALLLGLHLLGIAFTIGYSPLGVRDFILSIATLSVFMRGADMWCLDKAKEQ
ncbi:MAG: DoxX family membrane protein [Nanoarchaeota archaeon]